MRVFVRSLVIAVWLGWTPAFHGSANAVSRIERFPVFCAQRIDIPDADLPLSPIVMPQGQEAKSAPERGAKGYPLTIDASGVGTTDPASGTYYCQAYTVAQVYALKPWGGAFLGWQGDIGDADPLDPVLELYMDRARHVTAVFNSYDYFLTLNVSGTGSAVPSGVTAYYAGQTAILNAVPVADSGYAFNRWMGSVSGTELATSVFMDSDKEVTAEFVTPGDFALSIAVEGGAETGSTDLGTGEFSFMNGQTFALSALPAPRYQFVRWEGDIGSGDAYYPVLPVTMDQDRALTAVFEALVYRTLTIELEGSGKTSPAPGVYEYVNGSRAVVFAYYAMNSGYVFDHWEGDIGENDPYADYLEFELYEDRDIRAVFRPGDWLLNVEVRGSGDTYPRPGTYAFQDGEATRFEALPSPGHVFRGWAGDIGGGNAEEAVIDIPMTQNRDITAVFEPIASELCRLVASNAGSHLSDESAGYAAYDSFSGVTEPILGLRFWGMSAAPQSGGGLAPCVRRPNDFEVAFFSDSGFGEPGAILYQQQFNALEGQEDLFLSGVFEYGVKFARPLYIDAGWLSVRGVSGAECWFLWSGSGAGDNLCLLYNEAHAAYEPSSGDAAFCLVTLSGDDYHSADSNQDMIFSLTELLRVIQFFNTQGYYCRTNTEDGYGPGLGEDHHCSPHDSDYNPQDWQIGLSELLRVISFFNIGGYYPCPGQDTEDGFCSARE